VQRYLADEPVLACPPSAWYRLRKFARRKKGALAAAACLLLVIAVLAGSGAWTAGQRAAQKGERNRAVSAAVTGARVMLAEGKKPHDNPEHWQRTLPLARLAVERGEGLLTTGAVSEELAGQVREVREALDTAGEDSRLLVELDGIRLRRSIIVEGNKF